MQTFILVTLLVIVAALMVAGFKDEDTAKGNHRRGRLLIAVGFCVLALAGFVVYGLNGQGVFSIGICLIFGVAYMLRGLRTSHR